MGVFMLLVFMRRVLMFMRTMLPGMIMVMHMRVHGMGMLMGMLVQVFVYVGVPMLMRVDFVPVRMFMAVRVRMFMGV